MVAIDRRHQTCCICRQEPTSVEHRSTGDDYRYQCPRCGTFLVTGTTYALLWDTPHQNLLPYLSAFTRQASERGEEPRVDIETWRPIADGYRRTPIDTKLDRLLRYYAELSGSPGRRFALDEALQNYSLFAAYDTGEVQYLIDILKDQNAIKAVTQGYAQLTRDGWRQLNPRAPGGTPGSCFVAMAFDPRLDGAYETGIAKAVRNCGLTVTRVDRVEHNGYVTDLIMAAIRQAQVTIADVTLQRNGVYFEAGFALGLGRTVVWSCREDDLPNVHFDTRQYSHVVWKDSADLAERLERRIRATVNISVA